MKENRRTSLLLGDRCFDMSAVNELVSVLPEHKARIFGMYLSGYRFDEIAQMYLGTTEYVESVVNECIVKLRLRR